MGFCCHGPILSVKYKVDNEPIIRKILEKMETNKRSKSRTFFSIIILFSYLSFNVGSARGLVLCINSDGHVSLKFSSCESCCSPDLSHASETFNNICRNAGELHTEDSCCPCLDIPVFSNISQIWSRVTRDTEASRVSLANTSRLFPVPKTVERDYRRLQKIAYKNQISSLLKSTILLN